MNPPQYGSRKWVDMLLLMRTIGVELCSASGWSQSVSLCSMRLVTHTFDGPSSVTSSDIDTTAASGVANTAFDFRWMVCNN